MEEKRRTVVGTVITIERKVTRSNKLMVKARVRDKDFNITPIVLWEEMARDFLDRGMLEKKGHFEGYVQDSGDLSVKFFDSSEAPKRKVVPDNPKETEEYMRKHGFVRIKYDLSETLTKSRWAHKRYCVLVNGMWEGKVEYCMRVLGVSEVFDNLKRFSVTAINPIDYNNTLDNMMIIASQLNNDTLQVEDNRARDEDTKAMLGVENG